MQGEKRETLVKGIVERYYILKGKGLMEVEIILLKLKNWFDDYTSGFYSKEPMVQQNMILKAEHTRRVCEAILIIGGSLNLSSEDLFIAETCALLHDIGRFEQYKRYRTFSDHKSKDHAALGVDVIQELHVLDGIAPETAEMIVRAVKYHNRAILPENQTPRGLLFLKLLRDADKVDIWRVVTEYYHRSENQRNRSIELDLPDTPQVSDAVYDSLMNRTLVQMSDLKTLTDFKLLQMGWVYDLNFPMTFQIVREKRFLESLWDALPTSSSRVREIYKMVLGHVAENVFQR